MSRKISVVSIAPFIIEEISLVKISSDKWGFFFHFILLQKSFLILDFVMKLFKCHWRIFSSNSSIDFFKIVVQPIESKIIDNFFDGLHVFNNRLGVFGCIDEHITYTKRHGVRFVCKCSL